MGPVFWNKEGTALQKGIKTITNNHTVGGRICISMYLKCPETRAVTLQGSVSLAELPLEAEKSVYVE